LVDGIVDSKPIIDGRGKLYCRGCSGEELFTALDLGDLPIANELLLKRDHRIEKFPLHLRICPECKLGQVEEVVTPERIFKDYRYLSSMSSTFLNHASNFVLDRIKEGMFSADDWVLEIASNDGYLLRNFQKFGIRTIGVEPAENVADLSRRLGIETISEFFTRELAEKILATNGYPKLIIANNVMAHVPDLINFVQGLARLCGPQTQISVENPSLASILVGMQFDTIYHEHYSYLSASAVENICKRNGLFLFKVEELAIHGGSNRYWLKKSKLEDRSHESVRKVIGFEEKYKLFEPSEWNNYAIKVDHILSEFLNWLKIEKSSTRRVFGYGAAAKASTVLNSISLNQGMILAIADASAEKQNRFMPPNNIKIISPEQLFKEKPTDVVIFPWNIKNEIAEYLHSNLGKEVRLWCLIPEMHEVDLK
jgi:hypothetical protein